MLKNPKKAIMAIRYRLGKEVQLHDGGLTYIKEIH